MATFRIFLGNPPTSGGGPTNVTLAKAAWGWNGGVLAVNEKTQLTMASAVWRWNGFALAVNAKTAVVLGSAVWRWVARIFTEFAGGGGGGGTPPASRLPLMGAG